ncbi:MAG: hypothetical protein RUMPE_00493 [Eubacteriales bacterium SKADARSKE-1]|nr:hypothetical protein [Eubacteriales bacterium SKADARSKE-1]
MLLKIKVTDVTMLSITYFKKVKTLGKEIKNTIVGYVRISYDEDKENYESILNQKSILREYAKKNLGVDDIYIFEDDNFSGYSFNRPGFLAMRKEIEKGNINVILSKDLSRLGRHNAKTLLFIEDMQDINVRVVAINDGIDTAEDNNDITMGVKTWYNELYVKDISKKIRSTISNKQREGKWICAVPYGYEMIDPKQQLFKVDEISAEIVRRIFKLYTEDGWGYKKIANYLTDNNIPTPRMREKEVKESRGESFNRGIRKEWSIISISTIISNDFYVGTLRTGKYTRKKINGCDIKLNSKDHNVFENNHEAIVDKKTFDLAQRFLKSRSTNNYRGIKKYDNVYSGLLFCGDCGSPMFSISNAKRPAAYTCGSYHRRGLKGCTSHHILEKTLNLLLKKYLIGLRVNSEEMINEISKTLEQEKNKNKKVNNTVGLLQNQIEQVKKELKTLKMQRIREITKKPEQMEDIENLYDELEFDVINKLKGFENQLVHSEKTKKDVTQLKQVASNALSVFDNIIGKDTFSRVDLELIIGKIIVYENRIEVELKPDISNVFSIGETVVNFNSGNKNISKDLVIIQSAPKHKDKVFVSNVINNGSPSRILKVLLISFGITTLPRSSIRRTIPVAFTF